MTKESKRLFINLTVLLTLVGAIVVAWLLFFGGDNKPTIEDTPIQIESIRTIAEISMVSYKDEVVMDSVEFETEDYSFYDPRKYIDLYQRGVKRRLTMIITGEVRYGIDLTHNNYTLTSNADSIHLTLPQPTMLDVIIVPSKTEVYLEKGYWTDGERRKLESRAKEKFRLNAEELALKDKARENAERMFKKLIQDDRKLIIEFENE